MLAEQHANPLPSYAQFKDNSNSKGAVLMDRFVLIQMLGTNPRLLRVLDLIASFSRDNERVTILLAPLLRQALLVCAMFMKRAATSEVQHTVQPEQIRQLTEQLLVIMHRISCLPTVVANCSMMLPFLTKNALAKVTEAVADYLYSHEGPSAQAHRHTLLTLSLVPLPALEHVYNNTKPPPKVPIRMFQDAMARVIHKDVIHLNHFSTQLLSKQPQ